MFWQAVVLSRVVARGGLTQAGLCTGCVLKPGIATLQIYAGGVGVCFGKQ